MMGLFHDSYWNHSMEYESEFDWERSYPNTNQFDLVWVVNWTSGVDVFDFDCRKKSSTSIRQQIQAISIEI